MGAIANGLQTGASPQSLLAQGNSAWAPARRFLAIGSQEQPFGLCGALLRLLLDGFAFFFTGLALTEAPPLPSLNLSAQWRWGPLRRSADAGSLPRFYLGLSPHPLR